MPAFQGEACGLVVKVPGFFDLVEGAFRMAFGAVLAEAILVDVPVTVCAIFMGKGFEVPGFFSIPGDGPVA